MKAERLLPAARTAAKNNRRLLRPAVWFSAAALLLGTLLSFILSAVWRGPHTGWSGLLKNGITGFIGTLLTLYVYTGCIRYVGKSLNRPEKTARLLWRATGRQTAFAAVTALAVGIFWAGAGFLWETLAIPSPVEICLRLLLAALLCWLCFRLWLLPFLLCAQNPRGQQQSTQGIFAAAGRAWRATARFAGALDFIRLFLVPVLLVLALYTVLVLAAVLCIRQLPVLRALTEVVFPAASAVLVFYGGGFFQRGLLYGIYRAKETK